MYKKILYIQYTNPACYPPLEHSSRILADDGWKVLFLGTWDFTGKVMSFVPHPNISVRRIFFCHGGWFQKMHYISFCIWIFYWTLIWRPKWIYASDPLSCSIGLLLSYIPGLKIIYHEHDSPNPDRHMTYFMRFVFWTRYIFGHRATLCILPNEQRAERFTMEMGNLKNILTVWNCPLKEEVLEKREPKRNSKLTVYYHGNISPEYLPITILKAMAMSPFGISLQLVGYETVGAKGYKKYLRELALDLNIGDRVEFLDPMPRYKLLGKCSMSDVGLVFIPRDSPDINNRYKIGASNRLFDYLACGLALLVSDLPDWRKMYIEPGYGLACNPEDAESIAAGLRWFLEHPKEMRLMGERGRQRILKEWNYEKQFEPVLKTLQEK